MCTVVKEVCALYVWQCLDVYHVLFMMKCKSIYYSNQLLLFFHAAKHKHRLVGFIQFHFQHNYFYCGKDNAHNLLSLVIRCGFNCHGICPSSKKKGKRPWPDQKNERPHRNSTSVHNHQSDLW